MSFSIIVTCRETAHQIRRDFAVMQPPLYKLPLHLDCLQKSNNMDIVLKLNTIT